MARGLGFKSSSVQGSGDIPTSVLGVGSKAI